MISALAFLLFSLACAIMAFTHHPIFGLYFYMATTYVHPPSRWWSDMLPDMRWALLSALITIVAVAYHRGRLRDDRPVWYANVPAVVLVLYATVMTLQTPFALAPEMHQQGLVLFWKYIVAFWFFYRIADTVKNVRNILFMHAAGCAMLGAMARFSKREAGRVEGVGGPGIDDANTLAMFLATGAVVCIGLLMSQKGWRRLLALCLLPPILEGFVTCNSRGAMLGLVAGFAAFAIAKARAHRRAFWALGIVVALFSALAVDQMFIDRMFTIGDFAREDPDAEMSARSRTVILEAQVEMAKDHPMGVGHRGTVPLSPQYLDRQWLDGGGADPDAGRASHNTFMTSLVEQGVIGALLFTAMLVWLLLSVLRLSSLGRRPEIDPELVSLGAGACGGVVVVIVAGIATDYLLAEIQFWLLACTVSVFEIARRMQARARSDALAAPASGSTTTGADTRSRQARVPNKQVRRNR